MAILRNYLYILNLSLVTSLFLAIFFVNFAKNNYLQSAELIRKKKDLASNNYEPDFLAISHNAVPLSQIHGKRDIFGLTTDTSTVSQPKDVVSQNLPDLVIPDVPAYTPKKAIDFIDPLPITLVGTVISTVPEKSVCILGDETDKQAVYRIGDKFKDASLLKIFKDRVIFLRSNGQIETFFLYANQEQDLATDPSSVAKKESDNKIIVDLDKFAKLIKNFGSFLDYFDATPFINQKNNKIIGFLVLDNSQNSLAFALGFKYLDLILAVDGRTFTSNKNRQKILEYVLNQAKPGNFIVVKIERDGARMDLTLEFTDSNDTLQKTGTSQNKSAMKELVSKNKQDDKNLASLLVSKNTNSLGESLSTASTDQGREEAFQKNLERIKNEMLARAKMTGSK